MQVRPRISPLHQAVFDAQKRLALWTRAERHLASWAMLAWFVAAGGLALWFSRGVHEIELSPDVMTAGILPLVALLPALAFANGRRHLAAKLLHYAQRRASAGGEG